MRTDTNKTRGVRGRSLRRAEDFLQDTKEHVSDARKAGQQAIHPASTS